MLEYSSTSCQMPVSRVPTAIRVCKCSPRPHPRQPAQFLDVFPANFFSLGYPVNATASAVQPAPHLRTASAPRHAAAPSKLHLSSFVCLAPPEAELALSPLRFPLLGHPRRRWRPRNLWLLKEEVEECQLSQSAPPFTAPLCCLFRAPSILILSRVGNADSVGGKN